MDLIIEYGVFLLKVITIVTAIFLPILMIINSSKGKSVSEKGYLQIKNGLFNSFNSRISEVL